eukprot:79368-Prorocentrum_lima.AAC.1
MGCASWRKCVVESVGFSWFQVVSSCCLVYVCFVLCCAVVKCGVCLGSWICSGGRCLPKRLSLWEIFSWAICGSVEDLPWGGVG